MDLWLIFAAVDCGMIEISKQDHTDIGGEAWHGRKPSGATGAMR